MTDLTKPERELADTLGTAAGEDLRKALPKIRSRVAAIQRLDTMPGIEPGTGKSAANLYIDVILATINELRP